MDLRKNLAAGGAAATLLASLFAVSMAGPAFAATASPSTTIVPANGTPTTVALATVTANNRDGHHGRHPHPHPARRLLVGGHWDDHPDRLGRRRSP